MTSSELSYMADVPQIDTSKITAMEKYLIMHLIMCLNIKSKLVIGQCPLISVGTKGSSPNFASNTQQI